MCPIRSTSSAPLDFTDDILSATVHINSPEMEFCLSSTYKSSLILWTLLIIILRVNPIIFQRTSLPPMGAWTRAANLHCRVLKVFLGYSSFLKLFIFFQDHIGGLFTGTSISWSATKVKNIFFPLCICCRWYYIQNVVNLFVIKNLSIILNTNTFLLIHNQAQ